MNTKVTALPHVDKVSWSVLAILVRGVACILFLYCLFGVSDVEEMRKLVATYAILVWVSDWPAKKAGFLQSR